MSVPLALMLLTCAAAEPALSDDARATLIVVRGADGAAEYADVFNRASQRWLDAGKQAGATCISIGRESPKDQKTEHPGDDRALVQQALNSAAKAPAGGPVWLVLMGHGTYDGRAAKFNVRGPDISADDLAAWLPKDRPVAVVVGASASGPFVNRLSAPGRVIVTATKSGQEINFSRWSEHLAEAISDARADLDKDGGTSLLEAALWASRRVEQFYADDGRLATEHALVDDNGDGLGTPLAWFHGLRATRAAKEGAELDGVRAHQWRLAAAQDELPPAAREQRDRLELEIERLRQRKAALDENEYYGRLEPLLIQLSELYQLPEPRERSLPR